MVVVCGKIEKKKVEMAEEPFNGINFLPFDGSVCYAVFGQQMWARDVFQKKSNVIFAHFVHCWIWQIFFMLDLWSF